MHHRPHLTGGSARARRHRRAAALPAVALVAAVGLLSAGCAPFVAVPGASGCTLSPPTSFWHADVRALPVHARSATYVSNIGATAGLKADFGSGLWQGAKIGIPHTVIPGTQPLVDVALGYPDSDPGPYPMPTSPNVEGGGDKHVLLLDKDGCKLHELWNVQGSATAGWTAGSGAHFDLASNAVRTAGPTSADAAGLPILPGLVRYEEVAAGQLNHVIRITVPTTAGVYVWPASHKTGSASSTSYPPMGTWLRLKASVDENAFDPFLRPIIRALKTYGAVVADNGSAWYMSGVPDERWNNDLLATLGTIKGSSFEVVDASTQQVSTGSYQARTVL